MPELRKDPITGRWVIISTERAKRPHDFARDDAKRKGGLCPLCPGNEKMTPLEVYAIREDGSLPNRPGWNIRVVPNKFPALMIEGDQGKGAEGIYDRMNGIGAHEVILETPDHEKDIFDFDTKEIENVVIAYRERVLDLKKDLRFKYVLVFKNHGEEAGASLEHSHSQLIALPIVPKRVSEEIVGGYNYFRFRDRCVYCDIVDQELSAKERIIDENADFVSVAPYAPRFPFETWIIPKKHSAVFETTDNAELSSFAELVLLTLRRLNAVLSNPPFNFVIHASPFNVGEIEHYHWHLEIIPKLTKIAGFEFGSGFYINPTPPEEAARYLRESSS
ncbi:MAG: galactose-1-phosphate uridylyltransferase [Deltaproteobacteria bacterium]|nr:galactose-1-phosphate uridylyltransferase [Deltaproteobacteria bacterium]NIS77947.1 galactose-1-phosphate uridylyltransferase [Deltaproteobacteria bacterium]